MTGTLVSVDMSMNVHLKAVKVQVKGCETKSLDHFTIRGSNLRYFLLPDAINLETLLVDDTPKINSKKGGAAMRRKAKQSGGDAGRKGDRG